MGAFCGWLTSRGSELPPAERLRAMAAAFRGRRFQDASLPGEEAGLWVTAARPQAHLCVAEDPWVVIIGAPRWRDGVLAEQHESAGPADALRLAYRLHDLELFEHLSGTFAFAVVDRPRRRLLLAIDRMGIHSLCYADVAGDGLVYGTTADMVRAHPQVGASVPLQAVYGYLHAYVCRSPHTIYAEQRKLGPAQYLLWQEGRSRVGSYWRMPFTPDRERRPEELGEELVAQVRRAVRACVPTGDASVTGAFLSGGLDSSTVAGMLSEVTAAPADTFTIGFDEASYDEMTYAEAVIRRFGTRAHRHYLTADATADLVPRVAAYYDEPFGNSSALPAHLCAAEARAAGMARLLAGDGGDEVLAGNSRYLEQGLPGRYAGLPEPLRSSLRLVVFNMPLLRETAFWGRAQRYIARADTPLPERLEAYNFYQLSRMSEVFEPEALRTLDLDLPWREMREIYAGCVSGDSLQCMMHLDLKQALADADLKKVTGMCELAGIDVAFPFLDDDLVAFCATIPPELHLKGGRLRAFYKEAFEDFLPPEVIGKKKHGFGMPFYEWTREHPRLRELAYDSLGALRRRHYLRREFIDDVMSHHARPEPTPYDGLVWDLMMLELWLTSHGF